ncbi:MAG: SigE family RNA polymerase sigma factor [Marmoricola sp.]
MHTTMGGPPVRTDHHEPEAEHGFEAWMAARQRRLLHIAWLLTGDVHTAEDLVQTTLAKLYLAWDRVDRDGNVDAYARRILVNEHNSLWRRPWRRREVSTDDFTGREPSVEDDAYDGTNAELWRHVHALPRGQRAVIVLRYYEQLSEAETAAALGLSLGTVKSQASRGIATLRTRMAASAGSEVER